MAVYVIKKRNRKKEIVSLNYKDIGYEFKPNIKNEKMIQISNLYLYDEKMINIVLMKKMDKSFRRLAAITMSVLNDEDATSADAIIALDEVAKLKSCILKKYNKYLNKEEEELHLKRLKMLENNLKEKLLYLKSEEKSFSR